MERDGTVVGAGVRGMRDGLVAGAVGTLALEATTYLDMVLTGRSASGLPAEAAARMAGRFGVDLSGGEAPASNRREALGALMGYLTGTTVGAGYGAVRHALGYRPASPRQEALLLAVAATAAATVPMTAQGLTDPRSWGWRGWLEDLVPHLAYGVVAAAVLARLGRR
jgi:hypothetical protein